MKTIRTIIFTLLLLGFTAQHAHADKVFSDDKLKLGNQSSSANKSIEFNLGLGGSNPKIRANVSTQQLEFSNDGVNFLGIGSGSGSGSGYNIISTNPDWEAANAGWNSSGGVFSIVTSGSNLLFGKGSATFQASGSGQYFESAAYTIPNGLLGKACQVGIWQLGGDANLQLMAVDGSNAVVPGSAITLAAQSSPRPVVQTFQCPSSGTIKLRVVSTAASALAAFDRAYVGELSTQQVSQAQYWGTIKIGNNGTCQWSTSSNTTAWQNFPVNAACAGTYIIDGNVAAPGTNIPAVVLPNMPAGKWQFLVTGEFVTSAGAGMRLRLSDGGSNVTDWSGRAGNSMQTPWQYYELLTTSSQSSVQLQLQSSDSAGGNPTITADARASVLAIHVFYWPTQTQTAYRADQTPASWSGYTNGGASWNTASNTFVDPTVSGTPTLTTRGTPRNINCSQSGTNPAISCSLPRPGNYLIIANALANNNVTGAAADLQLIDGSGTQIATSAHMAENTTGYRQSNPLLGNYYAAAAGTATFKIQLKATGGGTVNMGTQSAANSIEWSIVELDAPMSMPFVLNQLTTDNANGDKHARAYAACGTGTCTVQQNVGIASVSRASAGRYTVNFSASEFSSAPVCTVSGVHANVGFACEPSGAATSTSIPVACQQITGTIQANDLDFHILCTGSK